MNNEHKIIHGAAEEIWETICYEFRRENIMKGQEPVFANTLRKKYEGMLNDCNLT